MSKGYMIFCRGTIWGVIFDKEEFKRFKKERNQDHYDVIKKDKKDIESMMAYRGISQFHTKEDTEEYGGILMFDHEELYILETVDEEIQHGYDTIKSCLSMFLHYYNFTESEGNMIKMMAVLSCELLRQAEMDYTGVKKEEIAKTWLEMMNLDD